MPFDVTPTDLAGTCGVVVVIGDVGATIRGAGIASGTQYDALDPSAFTIASCGDDPVHVDGVGGATTRVWLYPGLTASLLASTGLSADALLAHAEAEHILRALGYAPTDEVLEVPVVVTSTGAFASLDAPTLPASGCVPFVAYVVGAGRASLPTGQTDFLDDRALSAVIGCASGDGWSLTLVDDATLGARAFVRAYGAGSAPSTTLSVGSVTPVDLAHATWPTPIAELPHE
jgi:hypothetical protein